MYSFLFIRHPRALLGTSSPEKGVWNKTTQSEIVDKNSLNDFSKNLLEKFLNTKNKIEATEYLKQAKKDLWNLSPKILEEYSKKIAVLEQWLVNNRWIFDEKWVKKTIWKDTIKQITESLWLKDNIIPVVNSTEKQKEVDEFLKEYDNDILKFKRTVYIQCVEHPFITNTWIFLNDYKNAFFLWEKVFLLNIQLL